MSKMCEKISPFCVFIPFEVLQNVKNLTDKIGEISVNLFYYVPQKLKGKVDLAFGEMCSQGDILEFKREYNLSPEGEFCYIINSETFRT